MLAKGTDLIIWMAEQTDLSKERTIYVVMHQLFLMVYIEVRDKITPEELKAGEMPSHVADIVACPSNIVKFYHTHNSCHCFEKIYSHLKKTTELTTYCTGCHGVFNVKEIQDCSKCKSAQYCSQECQLAHWPEH